MEFEDLLFRVGDFGKYQRNLMLMFLFPAAALLPWFTMNIFYMISVPDHWCYVPELASSNLSLDIQKELIRPPGDPKCSMYNVNYTELLSLENMTVPLINATTRKCDRGWQYDKTYYDNTVATQWNMVCDDDHYGSLVLTMTNVGSIIGTPIYGVLSDSLGRKPIFFLTVVVTCVSAVASILMTNFSAFLVLRTINGSLMPSIFQLPYIILLEVVGPKMRTRMNGIANSSWTLGLCLLPLIAYLSRDWVTLGLVTSSVTIIFTIYWRVLPESPRWLLSRGRHVDAAKVLTDIAQKNGKKIDGSEILVQLKKLGENTKKNPENNVASESSAVNLFKYPQLRKVFFIVTITWVANIFSYYGLQINVTSLAGNEFLNFFILAVAEVPGFLCSWLFMTKLGRRWCSVTFLSLTAVACFVAVAYPEAGVYPSFVGKFACSASFMAIYQQSSELYPTSIRAQGMGLSGTMAGVANIAVPYIVYLGVYGPYIPFTIIGSTCLLAAFLCCFLPETLNESLPQSIMDAETFGLDQKFFSCHRRRRPSCYEHPPPHILKQFLNNHDLDKQYENSLQAADFTVLHPLKETNIV